MDASFVVQSIVTVAAAIGGGQLTTALLGRRKTSAEAEAKSAEAGTSKAQAAQIVADAAANLLPSFEKRIKDQDLRLDAQDLEIRELRADQRAQGELLTLHAMWDRTAVDALAEHGIVIGRPPPLYPATGTGSP